MTEESPKKIFSIRKIEPLSRKIIFGHEEEPLVIEQVWEKGGAERSRIINPERSFQVDMFVFWDDSVTVEQQQLIKEAIHELYQLIGFDAKKIQYFGNWHEADFQNEKSELVPHKSIKWQVESKFDSQRKQTNAEDILLTMRVDPHQVTSPHWEVIITNEDLYQPGTNFLIGSAVRDLGTIISLNRFNHIKDHRIRKETQKTELFHEISHVFGLPTIRRGAEKLEFALGGHCLNKGCSLQQGMSVPNDWINFTKDRLNQNGKPLCDECILDLKEKFRSDNL
jgi:predicted Zn-dependent protease